MVEKIMLDEVTLEQRLLTLEQTVSQLKQKVESQSSPENWLTQVVGSISDETAFLEALEDGRTFRQQS
ncbi:MAG: transferase hexapeptide repeat containing protein [Arthrospira sp. SH-MAG29]|nr:transferase hexapeptide repeat containing protein [Arthrospira sp. SH-MAG29]